MARPLIPGGPLPRTDLCCSLDERKAEVIEGAADLRPPQQYLGAGARGLPITQIPLPHIRNPLLGRTGLPSGLGWAGARQEESLHCARTARYF